MSAGEKFDYIGLGMPLPVDVFATLADMIGKAWPGATIITDPAAAGVPSDVMRNLGIGFSPRGATIIKVPTSRKGRRVAKRDAQAIATEHAAAADEDETRLNFHGFETTEEGHTSVGLSGAEELQHQLGAIGLAILDETEGAVNYVEWTIIDKESSRRAVLCVARSKGQTPHALRRAAEDKVARALEQLARAYESDGQTQRARTLEEAQNVIARAKAALEGR